MATTPYILYGGPYTRALITEMVMIEGDLPYELRVVDVVNDEHRSQEYLAINPAGWVPALITPDGETLYETPAINLWLAERHGLDGIAPALDDPDRAPFLCGLFYLTGELEPTMKRYFFPHRYVMRAEDTAAMKRQATEHAVDRLGVIDRRLAQNGPYCLGERFSLVDITLAYWTSAFEDTGRLDELPAVARCMELVRARSGLQPKFAELIAWRADYQALVAEGRGID